MRKFLLLGILFSVVSVVLTLVGVSFAKNPDVAPTVSIRSPKDRAVVIGNSLDVEVRFTSKKKGKANVRYIRVELDGDEVAIHQNKANIKDGIHTFHLDITDLSLGEHALQAFAYQAEIKTGLEGKSPIVIFTKSDTPIPSRIIKNPTAEPDGIFVDEPTLITITAEIAPDPDLVKSEITLQRLNELNQLIEFLGYLHDDGLEGDVTADDNIYTLEVNFNEPESTEIRLRIFAEYITTPTPISSDIFTVDAIIPISEEEFATILEVEDAAAQEFERLREIHNDDKARQLTVNWLKRQYGVDDAGISSDNDTIWILFTSGLEGGITTHPVGTKGNPSANSIEPLVIPEITNAIVLAPFFDEFSPWDESDYIAQKLSQLWSTTSTIKNSAVTVDLVKTLPQHAVVSISSHGSISEEDQVQIFTREKATLLNRLQHIFDLMTRRIAVVEGYYVIRPSFIKHYGNSYPKSLVYISACHSMGNNTMSNAFLDKGAYTYFGYDNIVNAPFAYTIGSGLFYYLLEDKMTTGGAFIALRDKTDPTDPYAEFLMVGGDDLVLEKEAGLVAKWNMGEGSGNILHDSSGNNSDGIIYGNPNWGSGILCFDGSDDWINVPDNDFFTFDNELSVKARVKPNTTSGILTIIRHHKQTGETEGWFLRINTGRIEAGVKIDGNFYPIDGTTTLSITEYSTLAMVWSDNLLKLYVNGQLDGSIATTGTGINSVTDIAIGRLSIGHSSEYFDGCIDEISVYKRALSVEEVK